MRAFLIVILAAILTGCVNTTAPDCGPVTEIPLHPREGVTQRAPTATAQLCVTPYDPWWNDAR